MDERGPCRCLQVLVGRAGSPVQQVLSDGGVEQVRLLRDHADDVSERLEGQAADVVAVDRNGPGGHVVQPRDEVGDRGLAGATGADQRGQLPRLDTQVHVLQGPFPEFGRGDRRALAVGGGGAGRLGRDRRPLLLGVVAERNVSQADLPADLLSRQGHGVRRVLDLMGHVQVFEDAVEQRHGGLHLHRDHQHLADGEEQPALQRGERGDGPSLDGRLPDSLVGDHDAGDQVDERRGDGEERADQREEVAPNHLLPDLEVGQPLVLVAEAADLVPLPPEHLGQQDARDRERLLRDGAHLGQGLLGDGGDPPPCPAHARREIQEYRRHRERQHGQLPGQDHHRDEGADDDDDVRQDARGGIGHHALDAAHVVRQAGLDLPRPGLGEEPERHHLQVAVQGVPEVLHHPLPDHIRQEGLAHADQARDDGNDDHEPGGPIEEVEVGRQQVRRNRAGPGEQRLVEDDGDQQWVHHPERGGQHDQGADQRDLSAVGPERANHAADGFAADGAIVVRVGNGAPEHVGRRRHPTGPARSHGDENNRLQDYPRPDPASTARARTASSIAGVSLPVNVFCWLGWKDPMSR